MIIIRYSLANVLTNTSIIERWTNMTQKNITKNHNSCQIQSQIQEDKKKRVK